MAPDVDVLTATRKSLHAVAELVLAGPQHRRSGSIRLRAVPGGFATVKEPFLAVRDDALFASERQIGKLSDTTCAELAAAAGVAAGEPQGKYAGGSGASPADRIHADPAAARVIAAAFGDGDAALRMLDPAASPVIWPEHFDIGITIGEVNYGVSPGDDHVVGPYAYVGPWTQRQGGFWNVPFGAARPLTELQDAAAICQFFDEGRRLAGA